MSADSLINAGQSRLVDPLQKLATRVSEFFATRGGKDKGITTLALSTESLSETQAAQVVSAYNAIESQLKAHLQQEGYELVKSFSAEAFSGKGVTEQQLDAAVMAGLAAADPQAALSARFRPLPEGASLLSGGFSDGRPVREYSTEAYDERDNRNSQMHSVMFNLLSARQDEFGETFYPTLVVAPNEQGVTLAMKLFYAYNDFKRNATGALANINRKNIVRAYADTSILKNDITRGVPVLRTSGADANTDKFVDTALVPSWAEDLGVGVTVTTAALKVDTPVDLIGISQTNELLQSGIMGPTDSLDTYIVLNKVYIKVTDGTNTDVIALNVKNLPGSTFTYSPQGNYRKMMLALDTDSLVLHPETTKVSGGPLQVLTELATHSARIQLTMTGSASLDKGTATISKGHLALSTLRNASNLLVTGATFDTFAGKIAACEVLGVNLEYYRANTNLRQRGQLVDTQTEYRVIPVNYSAPLGVLAPTSRDPADENAALQSLIMSNGIRISNSAVRALIRDLTALKGYKAVADASGNMPEMTAIGHFLVKPTYFEETVELDRTVNTLRSQDKFKDIRASLVEKLRYYATEMYRVSEYSAAAAVMSGGTPPRPTVIIGTDQLLFNYLTQDGDLRTLGEAFDVKVVSTLATEMAGKIVMSFGVFGQDRNTAVNPLQWGHMFYSPEVVVNLPISRDGQTSKELTVTPRVLHYNACPVATLLNVSGLPKVLERYALEEKVVA